MDVFLTIDVEHGGAAHVRRNPVPRQPSTTLDCETRGRALGLPFIVETLKKHGLRATFFVEPLASHYYGPEPLAATVGRLLDAGMDVQLHAHPAWLRFADGRERPDSLHAFPAGEQEAILGEAKGLLEKPGARITAFRAGSFAADNRTYEALRNLGIRHSSSYNLSYLQDGCRIQVPGRRNQPFRIGGLVEVPLTNYLIRDPRKAFRREAKHFQVGNTRLFHGRQILERSHAARLPCVNILLHNFEFVRRDRPDWHLQPFREHAGPVAGFQGLCAYLAANPERYAVRTFGELGADYGQTASGEAQDPRREDPIPAAAGFYWPL